MEHKITIVQGTDVQFDFITVGIATSIEVCFSSPFTTSLDTHFATPDFSSITDELATLKLSPVQTNALPVGTLRLDVRYTSDGTTKAVEETYTIYVRGFCG